MHHASLSSPNGNRVLEDGVAVQRNPALDLQTDFQRLQQQMTDVIYEQRCEMSTKPLEYSQRR